MKVRVSIPIAHVNVGPGKLEQIDIRPRLNHLLAWCRVGGNNLRWNRFCKTIDNSFVVFTTDHSGWKTECATNTVPRTTTRATIRVADEPCLSPRCVRH